MRTVLSLSTIIVLLDQATKLAVRGFSLFGIEHQGMMLYQSNQLFGDAVRITFVENPGMAFGLNFDLPLVLSLFSLGAAVFLVWLLWKTRDTGLTGLRLALALILAGAVGNLIDRSFYGIAFGYGSLFHGRVVDFIDVDLPDMSLFGNEIRRFWVFNVADSAVSIGVILLFFFYPGKAHPTAQPEAPTVDSIAGDRTPVTDNGADAIPDLKESVESESPPPNNTVGNA